jgi:hypothetical protein
VLVGLGGGWDGGEMECWVCIVDMDRKSKMEAILGGLALVSMVLEFDDVFFSGPYSLNVI